MAIHYRYVNYTRQEYARLSDLGDWGDGHHALLGASRALAWLMMPDWANGDGYCGRWRSLGVGLEGAHNIRFVAGYDLFEHMDEFVNVSPGLLQSMRASGACADAGWRPPVHDVALAQRVPATGIAGFRLVDAVSATCTCGWVLRPIRGHDRESTLERAVSRHVAAQGRVDR